MGISTFKLSDESTKKRRSYEAQTFNLMVLSSEQYIVEPGSLKFLVEHGFDFKKQYSKGIPYYGGNDRVKRP